MFDWHRPRNCEELLFRRRALTTGKDSNHPPLQSRELDWRNRQMPELEEVPLIDLARAGSTGGGTRMARKLRQLVRVKEKQLNAPVDAASKVILARPLYREIFSAADGFLARIEELQLLPELCQSGIVGFENHLQSFHVDIEKRPPGLRSNHSVLSE